ncbi:porin [Coraliomargarita sp. SDUM461003]|uniref:Porin n=1 Tax=Thalassobacterium maritimum TaxID=3041265 RepID=A0ABU1AZB2_9BACT|nr:porin [Coraliomargarita sp. SDUM461003]MDQ8208997.1 porin [Coraliomargarita sp. SDUM461003]
MKKTRSLRLPSASILIIAALTVAAGLPGTQAANSSQATHTSTTQQKSSNWFAWLADNPGSLYKNPENPLLQELKLMGRVHYELGYVDGSDVNNDDFSEGHDEYRRVRIGTQGKFLQYFGFKYQINLVSDARNTASGGDLDWGYDSIDEAYLSFDLAKALDSQHFDRLKLHYGRQKFVFSQEGHLSSNKMPTIERAALSNKVYDSGRPTGLKLDGAAGDWSFQAALYSSSTDGDDNAEFNGWQDDLLYYAHLAKKIDPQLKIGLDLSYNNADASSEDSVLSYRWASSLHATYDADIWGIAGDLIYGDNGGSDMTTDSERQGSFGGIVLTPYRWIVKDKLQAVAQYQYARAEESEGIRINSRYGRAAGTGSTPLADVNSGRGDEHHSIYTGLNYLLLGHQAKIQAGVEYQTMDTPSGDFDTLTWLFTFRTYF